MKNKETRRDWFEEVAPNAIFKKQTFELAETKENKEKAAILLTAVCIGDAVIAEMRKDILLNTKIVF